MSPDQDSPVVSRRGLRIAGLAAVVAIVAARSDGGGAFATLLVVTGGLLFGSWWLIGCAAVGVRDALRERDGEG